MSKHRPSDSDSPEQRLLFLPQRLSRGGFMKVKRDYGLVGETFSAPRWVLASNGQEYIVKGSATDPRGPYVAANELIAASLADHLGLPVLDYRVLEMGSELVFASAWMEQGTFYPFIDEKLFNECENRDCAYEIVALDVWLCNVDRHQGNLIARSKGSAKYLVLNDHGHCLSRPGLTPANLADLLTTGPNHCPYVRLKFLRSAIESWERMESAIAQIEDLHDQVIALAVRSEPSVFLTDDEIKLTEEFLMKRRDELRGVFEAHRQFFTGLKEAA